MSAILYIAIPLIAAFISIVWKKAAPYVVIGVSFFMVILLPYVTLDTIIIGGYEAPYGITLLHDSYSHVGLYVMNILFFFIVTISIKKYKKLSSVLLVALAGLNGLLLTNDLFNLFVFLEISGIAAYLITTTNKRPKSTFLYLVQGTIGSSLYLFGIIILYAMFGTLNISDLASVIAQSNVATSSLVLPFLLMFIGLGVEAKLLPFNAWAKGVLSRANALSGPMIASVYASVMAFVFGRIVTSLFLFNDRLYVIIIGILLLTIILGEAMAYASSHIREILLYSSVAQAGLVILLFTQGLAGWAVFMIVINAFSKFVMFLITTTATNSLKSDSLNANQGLFQSNLFIGIGFSVAALSTIGLPVFAGFIVKMNMLQGLMANSSYLFIAVILISSIVEGIYFINMLVILWKPTDKELNVRFNAVIQYVVMVIAVLLIMFGTYTAPLRQAVDTIDIQTITRGDEQPWQV